MIKAKKGLLIALFAAMMVFAFGATSAFATGDNSADYKWTAKCAKIEKADKSDAWQSSRVFYGGSDGFILATPVPNYVGEQGVPALSGYCFDLDGASLVYKYGGSDWTALNGKTFTWNSLWNSKLALKLVQPAYTEGYSATSPDAAYIELNKVMDPSVLAYTATLGPWTVPVTFDVDPEKASVDQPVAVTVGAPETTTEGTVIDQMTLDKAGISGTASNAAITIKGATGTPTSDGVWLVDGEYAYVVSGNLDLAYNGATQKVTLESFDGWTLEYQKYDTTKGDWTTATSIEAKDAGKYGMFRGVYTKGTTTVATKATTVTVEPASPFYFDWAHMSKGGSKYAQVPEGTNPVDYIVAKIGEETDIYKADAAEAKNVFNDAFEVEVKSASANNASLYTWTIQPKADVKWADLAKTYKTLFANYNISEYSHYNDDAQYVEIVASELKDDDINFTECPNVTYKYKAIKKKAKSFTVEAVADSGKTVAYKIDSPSKKITIDSATGTIKVAKKLKKGTYKVTVKAYTEAGNGYKACKAERQITVKIKK